MGETSADAWAVVAEFAEVYRELPASLRRLADGGVPTGRLAATTGLRVEHVTGLLMSVSTRARLEELTLLSERLCVSLGTLPDGGGGALAREEARCWVAEISSCGVLPHMAGGAGPVPSRARPAKGVAPEAADADELVEMLEDYLARAMKYLRDVSRGLPRSASVRGELSAVLYVLDYVYPVLDAV